ncbi:MAG: ankyrin repeat domain-containing protein [Gemmatimonadetes bacterium]|nr:ankyrin repeat domain-containing protein [Gemmatimonadota bacterium]
MPVRRLPVRPSLDQLRHQAKDLLRAIRAEDPAALAELGEFHPRPPNPTAARLSDAQLVLARSYQAPGWARLASACKMVDAIWHDEPEAVRALAAAEPRLLVEPVLIRESNWGPPLTYAANLGRDRIIQVLYQLGARDLPSAIDRATLQGQVGTARLLYDLMGRPTLPVEALGGPGYTLNVAGTELLLEYGVPVVDRGGTMLAPVAVVLETDSRDPAAKHRILSLYGERGVRYPRTAPMAVHLGRIDLLERHLADDPGLLARRFRHDDYYPPELGCHDEIQATHGTPLDGTTLLHLAIDFDEIAILRWLLTHGGDPNLPATVDRHGFGGHTALFATVVSQPAFWMNRGSQPVSDEATRLLLDHGADPTVRASLRKQLHPGYGETRAYEYRDLTAYQWGARFHRREFVNRAAMALVAPPGYASESLPPIDS